MKFGTAGLVDSASLGTPVWNDNAISSKNYYLHIVKQEKVPSKATENKATRGRSRATQSRQTSSEFNGRIPELPGTTFDLVGTKKANAFEDAQLNVAQYLAKEIKRGGEMRYTIMEITLFVIPGPTRPSRPIGDGTDGALNET